MKVLTVKPDHKFTALIGIDREDQKSFMTTHRTVSEVQKGPNAGTNTPVFRIQVLSVFLQC